MNKPLVTVKNGKPVTTSILVAETFGKRHDSVLRGIRDLMAKCPKEFTAHNFVESEYADSTGKHVPMYNLTRDGMTLLVMGYTGEKAIQFKLAYIEAFNTMEALLGRKQCVPMCESRYAQTIKEKIDDLEGHIRRTRHPGVAWAGMPNKDQYDATYALYCAAVESLYTIRVTVQAIDKLIEIDTRRPRR